MNSLCEPNPFSSLESSSSATHNKRRTGWKIIIKIYSCRSADLYLYTDHRTKTLNGCLVLKGTLRTQNRPHLSLTYNYISFKLWVDVGTSTKQCIITQSWDVITDLIFVFINNDTADSVVNPLIQIAYPSLTAPFDPECDNGDDSTY